MLRHTITAPARSASERKAWLALLPAALGSLALVTGCVSKEKIPFSDDAEVAREQAAVTVADGPTVQRLSSADERLVDSAVYAYLLDRDWWSNHQYAAVFLQGPDNEVAQLQARYPGHNPPIKASDQAILTPHQAPLDKDTGRPAMILSVESEAPVSDTVVATGRWYASDTNSGSYDFVLKKNAGAWVIDNVK